MIHEYTNVVSSTASLRGRGMEPYTVKDGVLEPLLKKDSEGQLVGLKPLERWEYRRPIHVFWMTSEELATTQKISDSYGTLIKLTEQQIACYKEHFVAVLYELSKPS